MTLSLYVNSDDERVVKKSITLMRTFNNVILKDKTSLVNPTFIITVNEGTFGKTSKVNYIYTPDFGRYYYITDVVFISKSVCEVHCRVDVLMSWKESLLQRQAIINRGEDRKVTNMYLEDGSFKTYVNPKVSLKNFPSAIGSSFHIYLLTTGTGSGD